MNQDIRNIPIFTGVLYGIALIAVFIAGWQAPALLGYKPTRVIRIDHPVKVGIGSYTELRQVLGAPDQEIPGEQISSQLQGATCGVWQSKKLVACGA